MSAMRTRKPHWTIWLKFIDLFSKFLRNQGHVDNNLQIPDSPLCNLQALSSEMEKPN